MIYVGRLKIEIGCREDSSIIDSRQPNHTQRWGGSLTNQKANQPNAKNRKIKHDPATYKISRRLNFHPKTNGANNSHGAYNPAVSRRLTPSPNKPAPTSTIQNFCCRTPRK